MMQDTWQIDRNRIDPNWPMSLQFPGGIHELAEEPPRDDSDAGEELEPSSDMVI